MENKKRVFDYLIFILCLTIVLVKFKSLSLPYFWDEAWPYATGAHLMYDNGLSLLPGAIPFDVSRGHPLLFHFLSALWMKIFGNSIFITHCFSLLISCCFIITIYFFGKKYFSSEIGFISALIIGVQPVFLAQSSMLLPEIMLGVFALLTLYFYLADKKILFIVSAVFLLLTKESGVIVLVSILIKEFFDYALINPKSSFKLFIKKIGLILLPILFSFYFFILQKIKTGNFFLPLYTSHENFIFNNIISKFSGYSAFLFIYQGRNVLSGIFVASLIFLFFKRRKNTFDKSEISLIYLLLIFIITFLFFSASNFYSPRYLLSILPPFILIVVYFYYKAFINIKWIFIPGLILVLTVGSFFCIHKKAINDQTLTYMDAVKVSQDAVRFCEENNLYEKNIFANFLMRTYLTNAYCGYLSTKKPFAKVFYEFSESIDYVIVQSFERENFFEPIQNDPRLKLIKRFNHGIAWSEIYEIN
jgi:4-amino-4-deoxy-L-arabinose transferase-like glycosyltransferase